MSESISKIASAIVIPGESTYVLLDTNYSEYYERLRTLSNVLDNYKGNFIPRLNKSGTRCLVQVKVKTNLCEWINPDDPGVLIVADKDWANEMTMTEPDWAGKVYNEWQVHRNFCTGKITAEEYEQKLEEGRATLDLTKKEKK